MQSPRIALMLAALTHGWTADPLIVGDDPLGSLELRHGDRELGLDFDLDGRLVYACGVGLSTDDIGKVLAEITKTVDVDAP